MSLNLYAPEAARRIVLKLIDDAIASGLTVSVNDGEETTLHKSRDKAALSEAMATTDHDYLTFHKDGTRLGWVMCIWENGHDVLSDYSDYPAIEELTKGAYALAAKIEAAA